jgi:hypothetical protein
MAKIILCECGTVLRGEEDRDLLQAARRHMRTNHPAIASHITDEELMALGHEDAAAPATRT